MEINLKLRSEILEYSLNIEESINNLLLMYLGIYDDNKKTRLFGNKPGITFKNKIDLLYDLQILSKAENYDFELLMNFRNKFLHDIQCNSFNSVFKQLDNSIKNRFASFLNGGDSIEVEEACLSAFKNLYLKNIRILLEKTNSKEKHIDKKASILRVFNDQTIYQIDLFFDFINEIYLSFEKEDLENEKVQGLINTISDVCEKYVNRYSTDKEFIDFEEKKHDFFSDSEMQNEFWNIVKSDALKSKIEELKRRS